MNALQGCQVTWRVLVLLLLLPLRRARGALRLPRRCALLCMQWHGYWSGCLLARAGPTLLTILMSPESGARAAPALMLPPWGALLALFCACYI